MPTNQSRAAAKSKAPIDAKRRGMQKFDQTDAKEAKARRVVDSNNGASDSEQDTKRRLGGFTGKGEHARQGGRKGIVGQTSKKFKTDKKQ